MTYEVKYTKAIGGEGKIIVKAENKNEAISNAKHLCATGSDFRNPVEVDRANYTKPRKQGFAGKN